MLKYDIWLWRVLVVSMIANLYNGMTLHDPASYAVAGIAAFTLAAFLAGWLHGG